MEQSESKVKAICELQDGRVLVCSWVDWEAGNLELLLDGNGNNSQIVELELVKKLTLPKYISKLFQ